jgi:hypothetical protein
VAAAPTRLVDLASYQQGINLGAVKAAGFGAVNIKLTQGVNYTWSAGRAYADAARALGMGICTFSWIDNSASGATQAAYAFRQMQAIGGPAGMAHQCDCEDTSRPATWAIWRDYVSWWQDKLGRHVANYTGDWWWQPRGWNGSGLTPYLWAAPNNGYLSTLPGRRVAGVERRIRRLGLVFVAAVRRLVDRQRRRRQPVQKRPSAIPRYGPRLPEEVTTWASPTSTPRI